MTKKSDEQKQQYDLYELAVWNLFIAYGKATEAQAVPRVRIYGRLLKRYDILIVNDAIDAILQKKQFLPALSEICEVCDKLTERERFRKMTASFRGEEE